MKERWLVLRLMIAPPHSGKSTFIAQQSIATPNLRMIDLDQQPEWWSAHKAAQLMTRDEKRRFKEMSNLAILNSLEARFPGSIVCTSDLGRWAKLRPAVGVLPTPEEYEARRRDREADIAAGKHSFRWEGGAAGALTKLLAYGQWLKELDIPCYHTFPHALDALLHQP